jgi:hypothetical protein
LETVKIDYAAKGVEFFYIYKPLAHPEFNGYVSPFNIEERLMHVAEAKRRLGSSITWLADTMNNEYHDVMGKTPNSEIVVNPEGKVEAIRIWSNPEELRKDLERLVGPVENPTEISDLNLPTQPPMPTVAKGVVPRVERPAGLSQMIIEPQLEGSRYPFYTKLRAEGSQELYQTGKGTMYVGFHLDPLYNVHWNNDAPPLEFEITTPEGITVTPAKVKGPDPEEPADADPREFLVQIDGAKQGETLDLSLKYYACDNALTFCVPVRQDYKVTLARDESHGRSLQTSNDGRILNGRR